MTRCCLQCCYSGSSAPGCELSAKHASEQAKHCRGQANSMLRSTFCKYSARAEIRARARATRRGKKSRAAYCNIGARSLEAHLAIERTRRASSACPSTLSIADELPELVLDVLQAAASDRGEIRVHAARICLRYAACAKNSERWRFFCAVLPRSHARKMR